MAETIGMMDQFRRGFPFDAHDTAVGMIVIRIQLRYSAVLDGSDGRAMRGAEGAVAADTFCRVERFSNVVHFQCTDSFNGFSCSNSSNRLTRSTLRSVHAPLLTF